MAELEQMIALAVATFFVIVIGYAVFFGSNVPFLLAARQKAIKELDPNVALNLKSQLFDSAVLSKPDIVKRLVFRGHHLAAPPDPIRIKGLLVTENFYVIAFYRKIFYHKAIMIVLREYCTPPTTPDLLISATGVQSLADHYYQPTYCDKQGQLLPKEVLHSLDLKTKNRYKLEVKRFLFSGTLNIVGKEQFQAQTGRSSEELIGLNFAGGDPMQQEQDEYGQKAVTK
jgi:hypothetical protein|tara:strand:- start:205 stop:888 length:684 start_codon:yes stop_codon:yes gene_type:complete